MRITVFWPVTEAEWHGLTTSSWAFSAVLHHSYYQAWSPAFDNSPVQNRFAGIGKVGYKGNRLSIQLAARQEWLNGSLVPFTPNLGMEWQLSRHWKLYGNAGRSFRLPTLNDFIGYLVATRISVPNWVGKPKQVFSWSSKRMFGFSVIA